MKTITKKLISGVLGIGMLALGLVWMSAGIARAEISSNTAAGLTIRINPNADRGVEITSGTGLGAINLGTVDVNFSTRTVFPATVTIMGNMATTELTMVATMTADTVGEGSWLFDNDPNGGETDSVATWALFSGVDIDTAPSNNEFEIYNATVTQAMGLATPVQVGDTTRFEGAWPAADMDNLAAAVKRHLWIRMRAPSAFSGTGFQDLHVTLTAEAAN